jgi:hypothetical protein
MRLVDFLVLLLEAQARTLQRLAALLGEAELLELLESAGEREADVVEPTLAWFGENLGGDYRELEGAVRELGLASMFEFHLWAYPLYRSLIESSLELGARIRPECAESLAESAFSASRAWVKGLYVPAQLCLQAESAAQVPWLRFRAEFMKRVGNRPLQPIG